MAIKYRELMKEYDVTFESDVLNKAFVSKAKDFETKMEAGSLTDEEIEAEDQELVELFNSLHERSVEDSDELKREKRHALISDAKAQIAACDVIEDLQELHTAYQESAPEVLPIIDKKIEKLSQAAAAAADEASKKETEKKTKFISEAKEFIKTATVETLKGARDSYKDYPDLLALIDKRLSEAPANKEKELAEKLRSKREWDYKELRDLGIQPTGNDMTVAGVKLEKEYLLTVYSVRK